MNKEKNIKIEFTFMTVDESDSGMITKKGTEEKLKPLKGEKFEKSRNDLTYRMVSIYKHLFQASRPSNN